MRVLSACDAGVEARFFNAIRWLQMSGKVSATVANVRTAARVPRRGGGGDRFRLFLTENGVCVFAFAIRTALRARRAMSTSKRAYLKQEGYYMC